MIRLAAFDVINDQALKALESGLNQDLEEKNAPPYREMPLSVLAHDGSATLVGGLTGKTVWDWLYIDLLWVEKENRSKGIARDLVARAEMIALERGCHSSYLWTQTFQAPDFYQKLGYQQFAVNEDFPIGHRRIGFMKRLAA